MKQLQTKPNGYSCVKNNLNKNKILDIFPKIPLGKGRKFHYYYGFKNGSVAERFNATVLKTVEG